MYFEAEDVGEEREGQRLDAAELLFQNLPFPWMSRIKLGSMWCVGHFGYPIRRYRSVEDVINTWPTTATSLGVRVDARVFKCMPRTA